MTLVTLRENEDKYHCGIMFSGAVTVDSSSDKKMPSGFGPRSHPKNDTTA